MRVYMTSRLQKFEFGSFVCFLLLAMLLEGCAYFDLGPDPIYTGVVSPMPSCECSCDVTIPCEQSPCLPVFGEVELGIDALVDIALRNNPKTTRAWHEARAAAYNVRKVSSEYYPSGEVLMRAATNHSLEYVNVDHGTERQAASYKNTFAQASLSYLLLDFGKRDANFLSAILQLESNNFSHQRVLQDVMLSVLVNYYKLVGARELLLAQELSIEDAKTSLEAAEMLHQAGIKSRVDALKARSNLVNVQLVEVQMQGNEEIRYAELLKVIGLPANAKMKVQGIPEDLPLSVMPTDLDPLIDEALRSRPDLAATHARYCKSLEQISIAESEIYPTLTAAVQGGYYDYSHHETTNKGDATASLILRMPFLDDICTRNRLLKVQEESVATYMELEEKRLSIVEEVVSRYYALHTAAETLKYSEEFLKDTSEVYEAYLTRYRQGLGTILDVLEAQSALATARIKKIHAKTTWGVALAELIHATGRFCSKKSYDYKSLEEAPREGKQ